jgi:hypothetical protein
MVQMAAHSVPPLSPELPIRFERDNLLARRDISKTCFGQKNMPSMPGKAPERSRVLPRILARLATLLVVATIIIWVVQRASLSFDRTTQPAGFGRGVLHGALMPMALPNLLVGQDITIYTANNTGRPYKLGYTVGVNGCGLIFFGFFFWRLNRLRKRLQPFNGAAPLGAARQGPSPTR